MWTHIRIRLPVEHFHCYDFGWYKSFSGLSFLLYRNSELLPFERERKKNISHVQTYNRWKKKYTSNIVHIYPNGEFFFCSSKNIRIPRAISNGDETQQKRREEQILQSEERLLLACFSFVLGAYLRFLPPPISKSPSLALFNRSPRSSILDGLYVWACLCGLLLYW